MKKMFSAEYLRDEVARIIAGTIAIRRASLLPDTYDPDIPPLDTNPSTGDHSNLVVQYLTSPPTDLEVDQFIAQCPFDDDLEIDLVNILLGYSEQSQIELDDNKLSMFQKNVLGWSEVNAWLAGDDWPIVYEGDIIFTSEFTILRQARYSEEQLHVLETKIEIARLSPSFRVLDRLIQMGMKFDALHWREFEELVAELLFKDGYSVELGSGRDDSGVDIIATKDLGEAGLFKSIWQAKKLRQGKKVGLSIIRELADTRIEQKASKGIIVTTTFLTSGALARVKRDEYILGKVDRKDLDAWINRIIRGRG